MEDEYLDIINRMQDCIDNGDTEIAHIEADDILREVALNTELSERQRRLIVYIYDEVEKWYA